jgi:hypothetical protein
LGRWPGRWWRQAFPSPPVEYPFGAADHTLVPEDLGRVGYVEDEYLVSGKANVYSWPAPGPAVVRTPNVPYTTRILVRRPAKASHFSGNVVVEILNPSNRFDLNIYPTHGAYVRAVARDTAKLVAGRYITAYDGLDLIREAAQAHVP